MTVVVFHGFAKLHPENKNNLILIISGSILFSLIHFPDPFLMAFTFFMEFIFLMVFNKFRNLWALGLTHGWVATFLLYFVQGRDLWKELFAWF
jgi:membrane protease YdiL (CAAX protease family)